MSPILARGPLPPSPRPWPALDPFLFCVHHDDAYPEANPDLSPRPGVAGRNLGSDFSNTDGWSMYHGRVVPGFPRHPHRGFETVTVARQGYIDHADSTGATARYGNGDLQWMTAGNGIVHSEMFPLVNQDAPNPGELFQIWLNLPARSKRVDPYFRMIWAEQIPRHQPADGVEVATMAGSLDGSPMPEPPPDSWASDPRSGVAVWTVKLAAGARWTLPAAEAGLHRVLYAFDTRGITVGGEAFKVPSAIQVHSDQAVELVNGDAPSELLLLQGRPIGEPVAQHGPFVMNSREEIMQAYDDYRRTQFGGWPWKDDAPHHGPTAGRFAVHTDGRREEPPA